MAVLAIALSSCERRTTNAAITFVGSEQCASCHEAEYARWKMSQHAVAMQRADDRSVLGDFDNANLATRAGTVTFRRLGGKYVINAEDATGKRGDFEVRYTFGVYPLQQYLVAYGGGRLQALSAAWDARMPIAGGHRWFSLAPDDVIEHGSAEHWTGRGYNWNYMCADCHSTGVRKGYVPLTDTYHTRRAEIAVGCEGCHGPGGAHVAWGEYPKLLRQTIWADNGLQAPLDERRGVTWSRRGDARIATRSSPRHSDREIETCAQCHARRVHIAEGYTAGKPLLDYYIPALLTSDLYFADGQQREEVYTYGSFLQSRMYAAGVTCSDCHDPHLGRPRLAGNALCTQCHSAPAYDTSAHHFHRTASAGTSCVACHMPDTTYMRIDRRHDHSFRIPRPDESVMFGVPNACTRCHTDRDAAWAAGHVAAWYPRRTAGHQRFAFAFAADDANDPRARDSLLAVVNDAAAGGPAIARASALARLAAYADSTTFRAAAAAVRDTHALVRLGALQLLEAAPPAYRNQPATQLLRDERRAIRQGAAWVLASTSRELSGEDRKAFDVAAGEFIDSQRYNADQPDDRLVLGAFYAQLGKYDSAAVEYRAALALEPRMTRASVFLAAVLRAQGRLPEAIAVLDSARARAPHDSSVLRSLHAYRAEAGLSGSARSRP